MTARRRATRRPGDRGAGAARTSGRATWDYHRRTAEFFAWARDVESRTLLLNGADLFAWNADEGYLVDLDLPHVPAVPLDDASGLAEATARWGSCVVKPRVGASGGGVVVVDGPGRLASRREAG